MSRTKINFMQKGTIPGRITYLREHLGFTIKQFSKETGMSLTNMYRIEEGKVNLSDRFLRTLTMQFAINPKWVLTGESEMFLTAADYIDQGIDLFGDEKMSEGLAKVMANPQRVKFQSLVAANDILQSDIDEELAAYLQYILKMWHEGERDRHWVMGQLERAFQEVGERALKSNQTNIVSENQNVDNSKK
jgi:transcriptional regulator with XRE-family HTH domain